MDLEIKNFGPIKKGSINLDKRFYVFVGYNNSGKTYISQLLAAFFESVWDESIQPIGYLAGGLGLHEQIVLDHNFIEKFLKSYEHLLRKKILPKYLNIPANYFVLDTSLFNLKDFNDSILNDKSLRYELNFIKQGWIYEFFKNKESNVLQPGTNSVLGDETTTRKREVHLDIDHESDYRIHEMTNVFIADMVKYSVLNSYRFHMFLLPANRVFYPSFYKYIYSTAKQENEQIGELVRNSSNVDIDKIKDLSDKPYTKAMDKIIEKTYNLDKQRPIDTYNDLLEELEQLMGGKIVVKQTEGIAPHKFYLQMDNGEELDMYLSSSAANQLTTLYLYLKYWAGKEHNFLIIDEPEENLHPKNQIALLDILMKFADRNNNKVIITTHSPLMAEAVNNHAHISYLQDKGENMEELLAGNEDFTPHENLKFEDYGVYFFNGEGIEEYEIGEYGAFFSDFRKEEEKIKKTANKLKNRIHDILHNKPADVKK